MRLVVLCMVLGVLGQVAAAEAPARSLRPLLRPGVLAAPVAKDAMGQGVTGQDAAGQEARGQGVTQSPRPLHRPGAGIAPVELAPVELVPADSASALPPVPTPPVQMPPEPAVPAATVLHPKHRPEGLVTAAAVDPAPKAKTKAKVKDASTPSTKGSVCGDPAIKGEALAPIKAKVKGCGLAAPVRVTSLSGIRLNAPATISCDTATAFKTWIDRGLRPAMGRAEVIEIRIAASYVCRPRNNKKGAKISEHGRGQAVDVAGFLFADGTEWSVKQNYNKQIRKAHKAACGIFGTTLGPGSDGYHEDHLHFDIARYRGGDYCK